jgi:hypothetical protein
MFLLPLDLFVYLSIWSLFLCISVCLSLSLWLFKCSIRLFTMHSFIILEITIWAVAKNKSVGWQWYGISAVRVRDKRVVYPMKLDSWPGNCFIEGSQYLNIVNIYGGLVGPLDPIIGVYPAFILDWCLDLALCHRCHKIVHGRNPAPPWMIESL